MIEENSTPALNRGPVDHDVRDQIVVAATEHFRLYGYGKTTVSDLAKSIGFSKAYIYKFFSSKQAIGESICTNCIDKIEADVRRAIEEVDQPPEKLRRMFKEIVQARLTEVESRIAELELMRNSLKHLDDACCGTSHSSVYCSILEALEQGATEFKQEKV